MTMVTTKTLATELNDDLRALHQDELNSISGGFINDNGCCPVLIWGPGGIRFPHGPNPWLTWGSPERGGH
jgi:hypothetical protein